MQSRGAVYHANIGSDASDHERTAVTHCDNCGARFYQSRADHRFCSIACNHEFHIAERRAAMEFFARSGDVGVSKPRPSQRISLERTRMITKPTCMHCGKLIADTSAPARFCSRACFNTLLEKVKADWNQRFREAKANGNGATCATVKPLSEIMQRLKARASHLVKCSKRCPSQSFIKAEGLVMATHEFNNHATQSERREVLRNDVLPPTEHR